MSQAMCAWTKKKFLQNPRLQSPCKAAVEPYGKIVTVRYESQAAFQKDIISVTAGDSKIDMKTLYDMFMVQWPKISEKEIGKMMQLPSVGLLRVFDINKNGTAYGLGVRKHWKIVRINGKLFRNRKFQAMNSWLPTDKLDLEKVNKEYPVANKTGGPFEIDFESNDEVNAANHYRVRVNYHCMGMTGIFQNKAESGFFMKLVQHFVSWLKEKFQKTVETDWLMSADEYLGRFLCVIAEAMPNREDDNLWPSELEPDFAQCGQWDPRVLGSRPKLVYS